MARLQGEKQHESHVTFRHDEYIRSHGKQPKGFGNWAFNVTLCDGNGSYSAGNEEPVFITGTLTHAKKTMRLRAKAMNDTSRCREILVDVLG